ncbi:MAG: hypothetical protein GF400_04780 [Candidatus Eisenbacteria bacterium]|nr:hypothetical protein [Candidatus Eisenbacteria bacterium]
MQNRCRMLRSVAAACVLVLTIAICGCSTVGPESSWSGNSGSVEGVVRSNDGDALAGIDVTMRAQTSDGDWIEYEVTTGAGGAYELDGVELGNEHSFEKDYDVYVNRTVASALPIVSAYGTYVGTISVSVSGTTCDVTIREGDSGAPDTYVD